MEKFQPSSYGDRIFEVYDELYPAVAPECIELLLRLAGDGPALELGIGTGRVALPLRDAGAEVHGIDASAEMLNVLKSKTKQGSFPLTQSDFSSFSTGQRYPLIYVVFNTIFALTQQEDQIRCFACVAQHLAPGGQFLVEAFVPDLARFTSNQTVRVVDIGENQVQLDLSRHDPASQMILSQHVFIDGERTRLYPVKLRYIWPSEMDLMARLAGLELAHRWGSWRAEPFGSSSERHISVYRLPV